MKKILLAFLFAFLFVISNTHAAPSMSATIRANTYIAKGATTIPLVAAQATLLPTPFPTQFVTIHKTDNSVPDETYIYVSKNNSNDTIVTSPGMTKAKYRHVSYTLAFATAVPATPTPTITNTPTVTPTRTSTPSPTPKVLQVVSFNGTANNPVSVTVAFPAGTFVVIPGYSDPCTACIGAIAVKQVGSPVTQLVFTPGSGTLGIWNAVAAAFGN